jgi:CRP-like cAMP-binding protein
MSRVFLAKGGPEQQAIEAGEIDAIVDHATSNVILLPAARRALQLRKAANEAPIANRLLAALPRAEYQHLLALLEPFTLKLGEVLHEPGLPVPYLYFPMEGAVGLLATPEGPEIGLVGFEGAVGISLTLGADVSSSRALVQASGKALRIKAAHFKKVSAQCPALQRGLYRYVASMLAQARQTIACNRFHSSEARLARWLLMSADRVRSDEFFLTQAFLADMLGVRRATVNEAAGSLQHCDLIGYSRGMIRILDRVGLEAAACPCYRRLEDANVRARTDADNGRA